jgi:FixJ family two-component response regulator
MQETPLIPIVVDDESVREARKGLERFGFIAETFESATWPCKCLA